MAIYLSRKKGGAVATPITPSNSSPAQMTADTPVNPTANGYAIESYSNLAPSNSSPATITSGSIYKASSNGKAVASINTINPSVRKTVIYPNQHYRITTEFASVVSQIFDVQPNDSNPPSLDGYQNYFIDDPIGGYLYATEQPTPTSKTPSDSNPPSVSSGAIIKASASGYLYSSSGLGKRKSGTFTSSTSSQTINLGFQPKYILIMSSALTTNIFDYTYSTTKGIYATANAGATEYTISGNTSNNHISAITSTGFTFNKSGSSGTTIYYFAMA